MFKLWHVSSMDKKGVSSKPQRLSFSPYKNKFKASDCCRRGQDAALGGTE